MTVVRHRRRTVSVMLGSLLLVACAGDDEANTEPSVSMPDIEPTATATSVSPNTEPPEATSVETGADGEYSLEAQLSWFVEVLNGADPSEYDYDAHFAPAFTSHVSFADFTALLPQVRDGQTGWTVAEIESSGEGSGTYLLAPAAGPPVVRVHIGVADADGRIETLFLEPAEPPSLDDPPETFDEAVGRLEELGRTSSLVAEVTEGDCVPIEESDADFAVPIGSAFKLYVLGAVADAIERGELAWECELVVTDELLSLPSGITQEEELGTALTVRELAGRMIAISDNTATDMLIDAVGREAVTAIQDPMGHTASVLNRPFLTTRELFVLKLDHELLARFETADPDGRSAMLDEIADRPLPELDAGDFTEPVAPDRVEWFASPSDLCRALIYLYERSEQPGLEPVREIMTESPGIPDDRFDEIWFKGGSEPGLIAVAWLVRDGERSFTVTGAVVNPNVAFDPDMSVLLLASMRDLVPSGSR